LPDLTQVYAQFLQVLWAAGVREVQIDEPHLVCDHTQDELDAWALSMQSLCAASDLGICLSTYFGHLDALTLEYVRSLPLAELHVDLTQDTRAQLPAILAAISPTTRLSAGVVSGRNIWATDVERALTDLDLIAQTIGIERLSVATSCSLLHVPYALDGENKIPSEIREWLAFGREKLDEITLLQKALVLTAPDRDVLLEDARARQRQRRESTLINDASVRARISALSERSRSRALPLRERLALQHQRLQLPLLPTTTIGSFPQTSLIRLARARWRKHEIDDSAYETFIANEIESCIHLQERLGLDVLVHGESERNDMVEYFGERLQGFAFTANGWVQSYGSRCVKPPILYGAVSRPQPMTVRWWDYAQSLTSKSVKGMLTGPITILQWSWVRDDQPLETTATEIALAVSDEVEDLQAAGAAIIQVDEAALREGLPLRMSEHAPYLRWAIDSFRLAVARAQPQTQIHTHMCYSHFADMFKDIARLDADVLSIEASRSGMELLDIFRDFAYEGEIGPGVYDIHSPRVPTTQEIKALIALAAQRLRPQQMWVNPDCGLKTRTADEVKAALTNLVAAAAASRRELSV
jgi:5-methyltetrahydropteroyltriglutamate--homocysteine methyltransferase